MRVYVPLAFTRQGQVRRAALQPEPRRHWAARPPDVTIQQAQARLDALNAGYIERAGPLKDAAPVNAKYNTVVSALEADIVRDVRGALQLLWGGVLFVLLIAGGQHHEPVARARQRPRQGTRHASRPRRGAVARHAATGHRNDRWSRCIGGAAGLGVGYWCVDALKKSGLWDLPRAHEIHMDGTVIAFTFGVAVLLGLVVGAVPALQLAGFNLNSVLREEGRGGTASRGARYVRRSLVVAQVALAFILLIGAGLLLASFRQLLGRRSGLPRRARHHRPRQPAARRSIQTIRRCGRTRRARSPAFARCPASKPPASAASCHSAGTAAAVSIIPEGYVMAPGESVVSPNQPARQRRLSRGAARAVEARAVLHGQRHRHRAEGHHRRRAAGKEVLAECRSDWSSHVPARTSRKTSRSRARRSSGCRWSASSAR